MKQNKSMTLNRFLEAQGDGVYEKALEEVQKGKKETHWMWFIFPQIAGLGHSDVSKFYAIQSLEEATEYLKHPILGARLVQITQSILALKGFTPEEVFGFPDYLKLKSSMTLFAQVEECDEVFFEILDFWFGGELCGDTLSRI